MDLHRACRGVPQGRRSQIQEAKARCSILPPRCGASIFRLLQIPAPPIPLPPSPKFFPLIPFDDPHALHPYAAILYNNMAGEGPSQHTVSLKFFPCHRFENSPVSPAVATDPKTPYRKSFPCHTSETP